MSSTPVPPIEGVLFDFAHTLFRMDDPATLIARVAGTAGRAGLVTRADELGRELTAAHRHPRVLELWRGGDLSVEGHAAYRAGWIARVPALAPVATALSAAMTDPAHWSPYTDTAPVLAALRERGVPVAVVSNIGWDVRTVFAAHGLAGLVDAWALSYEVGAVKPDPVIFRHALAELGVEARHALMVGDTAGADGAASAVGCRVHLVPGTDPSGLWLGTAERVRGLGAVLHLVDGARG